MGPAAWGAGGVQRVWRVSGLCRPAGSGRLAAGCANGAREERHGLDDVGLLGVVWAGDEEGWEDGGRRSNAARARDEITRTNIVALVDLPFDFATQLLTERFRYRTQILCERLAPFFYGFLRQVLESLSYRLGCVFALGLQRTGEGFLNPVLNGAQ